MGAKRRRPNTAASASDFTPAAQPPPSAAPGASASAASADSLAASDTPSWFDSPDPRRRTLARALLVVVWLYVAALWLLALDQNFNWGLFGPKLPPLG